MTAEGQWAGQAPVLEPVRTQRPTAAPRTNGQPIATVTAAAQPNAQGPRSFFSPASRRGPAAPVPTPPEPLPAPTSAHSGQTTEPPHERPACREPLELPVLRIVCWQLALVLVLLAIGRPWPVVTGLLLAVAGILGSTAVRVRGRWLSDELAARARLSLRRRGHDLPENENGRMLLRTLAPGAQVHPAELAGAPAGVVSRAEELLIVLRPVETGAAELTRLALSGALSADHDEGAPALPAIRLQLVLHRGPRATDRTRAWLAVRALRDPDLADDADLLGALNNTARKLHRLLRKRGMRAVALTEPEVLTTLVALTHTGPGRSTLREERRHWRAGPITQVGLRLAGLGSPPVPARLHALHRLLGAVPGAACTIAITVPGNAAVMRVAAMSDPAVDAAAERLSRMSPAGVRLERMDNQQGPAVAASLPIGGNP